ncbi:hypothetical protein TNCT_497931 [Trichonephila clavata]|uniref:Uncharacterized protein n=1 Tax=Trichonephila clavata TaxID=2740835 RepID=A0A8X6GDM4_TRICU|nr:hypothetical protein TNCT_497931 [Trichonephila clavata]
MVPIGQASFIDDRNAETSYYTSVVGHCFLDVVDLHELLTRNCFFSPADRLLLFSGVNLDSPDTHPMNRIETPSHTLTAASDTESPSPRGQSTKGLKLLTSMIASVTDSPRSCPRDTRLMASPSPPGTSTQMDTDEDGPDKVRTCNKISNLENKILCDAQRMAYLADHNQEIPQGNPEYAKDIMLQHEEKENLQKKMDTVKGELASLLPCPFPNCVHNTAPKNLEKTKAPSASNLAKKLAETHIDETNNKNKKNQQDDFSYPGKTAKKPRILENYNIGVLPQIETSNKFTALAGSDSQPALTDAAIPVAPPRSPP